MRTAALLLSGVVVLLLQSGLSRAAPPDLPGEAISSDTSVRDAAIAKLRAQGPGGLEMLLTAYDADIAAHWKNAESGVPCDLRWQRIATAIDRVAGQRDAAASR